MSNDKTRLAWWWNASVAKTHGMKGMESSQEPQELWEPLGEGYKHPEGLEIILLPLGPRCVGHSTQPVGAAPSSLPKGWDPWV